MIKITVAFALPMAQFEIPISIEKNCTAALAIKRSGLLERFPEIAFSTISIGVFGKRIDLDYLVRAGDRLEIYRPLRIDPKKARRLRAKRAIKK